MVTCNRANSIANLAEELYNLFALQVVHSFLASRREKQLHKQVDTASESILLGGREGTEKEGERGGGEGRREGGEEEDKGRVE